MSLKNPPAFEGQITITAGVNDTIYWHEDDGSTYDLSTTVAAGTYWLDSLATALETAMNAESLASGASLTYTWSHSITTGLVTCARATGSGQFYLKSTTAETNNILRGGDNDSSGNALTTDQYGFNGLGWAVEVGYLPLGTSVESDHHRAHWWSPEYPPQTDDDGVEFESTFAQAFAIDGTPKTYDFMSWSNSNAEFPIYGGLSRMQTLSFEFVTTAYKHEWIAEFWGPYGKAGKTFRYYPDNTATGTYTLNILMGDSLRNHGFSSRINSQGWWQGSIQMHRVAS